MKSQPSIGRDVKENLVVSKCINQSRFERYATQNIFHIIDYRRRTGFEIRIIEQKAHFVFVPPGMRSPTNFEDSANNISCH